MPAKRKFTPPPPGNRRKASWHQCRTCGQLVGVGLDADVCAISVTVDPQRLTVLGEAKCLIGGWRTYDIWRGSICFRDPWHISGMRAEDPNVWVVKEHTCYVTVPEDWTQLPVERLRPKKLEVVYGIPF